MSLILFPFHDENGYDLINAIVVPYIPLWTDSRLNTALIGALFAFSIGKVTSIPYPKKLGDTTLLKKTFKKSEVDQLCAQLRENDKELKEPTDKELEELLKEKDKELTELRKTIKKMEEELNKQDNELQMCRKKIKTLEEKDKKL